MSDQNTNQKNANENMGLGESTQKPQKPGAEPVRQPQSGIPNQQPDKGDMRKDKDAADKKDVGETTKKF